MRDSKMPNYRHVLTERDYKSSVDDERNKRRDKDKNSSLKHTSHSHKSRRSNSPHQRDHHRKSPLKSKIGYNNSDPHKSKKQRENEINESYEELSRRKRKLESELRALDLEEAAEREAKSKKSRRPDKPDSSKKKVPDKKEHRDHRPSSKSDNDDRKSSKSKTLPVSVKAEKDKYKGHASRSSGDDRRRGGDLGDEWRYSDENTSSADERSWGISQEEAKKDSKKEKPNLAVSGKLAEETNVYNGVVIKYNEPQEARKPKRKWRLYPFKGDSNLPFIPIHRQSAYLFGRTRLIADIPIDHPSCSKQHAVLQYRLVPYKREDGTTGRRVRPYIIDLESSNGTFVNNKKINPRCYVELIEQDVVKFGYSSREYVILHEESKIDDDDDVIETND